MKNKISISIPLQLAIIVYFSIVLINGLIGSNFINTTTSIVFDFITKSKIIMITPEKTSPLHSIYIPNIFTFESIIMALIPAILVYYFSKKHFDSLNEITHLTQKINSGALNIRIPNDTKITEFSHLIHTINTTLDNIDSAFKQQKTSYQEQGRFVADAAHELKTPITIIQSNLESLNNPSLSDKETQSIIANQSIALTKLNNLVNDLLLLASTGKINKSTIYPALILEEVKSNFSQIAKQKEVTINLSGDANITAYGDSNLLQIVFSNLLENSICYNKVGGKADIILTKDNDYAKIIFKDNGIGISSKDQEHLFDRFYRSKNTINHNPNGTGLGLCIAEHILKRHNATIELKSEIGIGSKFIIKIPQN